MKNFFILLFTFIAMLFVSNATPAPPSTKEKATYNYECIQMAHSMYVVEVPVYAPVVSITSHQDAQHYNPTQTTHTFVYVIHAARSMVIVNWIAIGAPKSNKPIPPTKIERQCFIHNNLQFYPSRISTKARTQA